mgnify:CR=1
MLYRVDPLVPLAGTVLNRVVNTPLERQNQFLPDTGCRLSALLHYQVARSHWSDVYERDTQQMETSDNRDLC